MRKLNKKNLRRNIVVLFGEYMAGSMFGFCD